jgi:hypothetical protein
MGVGRGGPAFPIILPTLGLQSISSPPISESSKFTVIGKGSRSNDLIEMQEELYEVEISWQTCSVYPAEYISDNMFCAADFGKDSCYVGSFSGY